VFAATGFEKAGVDMLDITDGLSGYLRPGHTEPGYFAEFSQAIAIEAHGGWPDAFLGGL